ncbi:MAG: DNA-directed RNA polymerase subunit omega [Butyrivibrio sp.]|nr:DNA-directed RNA polymerase subunit omega [Butyrivibrio sp.]
MIHPSYVDLMKVVNKGVEEGEEPVISSRYSVVMATAKRARQIIAGDEPLVKTKAKEKPLSIAVRELDQGQIRILSDEEKKTLEEKNQANTGNSEQNTTESEDEKNN